METKDGVTLLSEGLFENQNSSFKRKHSSDSYSLFANLLVSIKSKLFGQSAHLSLITSSFIMVSLSYGSAVVILPYTISQLGAITWTLYTALIIFTLAFCTVLLKECCVKIMEEEEEYALLRHPYPTIAEIVVGPRFSKLVRATLYVCLVFMVLAFILLAATILTNIIPIPLPYYHQIRIWLVVTFLLCFPLMMIGTYADLEMPAIIAVVSSTVSMFCIIFISVIAKFWYHNNVECQVSQDTIASKESFFIIFGDITFAAAGPAIALPNIIVLMKEPDKFHRAIFLSHFIIFFIYVICAVTPYAVFGEMVRPSITDTLTMFLQKHSTCHSCNVLLVVCQICMTVHCILVAVLSINPVFLSLENVLGIPLDFSCKRVLVRSCVLIGMLMFALFIPYFSPVLSMVGAVPQTLLTVIYPSIIYWNLFSTSRFMKIFLGMLCSLAFTLIVGNTIFSMMNIVNAIKKWN